MALLTARSIGVRWGNRDLLRDVSLSIRPGEVVALVGPNGAGKSTLLRVLAGDLRPTSGLAVFDGVDIAAWRPRDLARRRAVVTQHADRDCPLTARQIVDLGRLPWGRPARDDDGRRAVDRAMAATGVERFADRRFSTLSGGERQRVHLARALAQAFGPQAHVGRLLILDEPTSHMDIAAQLSCLDLLARLAMGGLAAIVAVHDLAAAAKADRVCVLREGRGLVFDHPGAALTPAAIDAAFDVRAERFTGASGAAAFAYSL